MALTRRRITDAVALKALAHPVRMALLEALVTEGPLTATQASAMVGGESASNCSWHLRKLAEHGFVREARGGTGRHRPWQVVSEALEWGADEPGDPDARAGGGRLAAEAVTDLLVEREMQRFRAARASRNQESEAWRTATGLVQSQLWLTAEEARQVGETLAAVLASHANRATAPESRPSDARLVSLVAWLVPSGPQRESATSEP